MLKAEQLTFSYDNKKVLKFPELHCRAGEQWLLLGQSGCGKTTLLHLLGGLLRPLKGSVLVGDRNIGQLSGATLDKYRGQHIGIIFQQSHFIKALTVEENLLLAQKFSSKPADRKAIRQLLERLNIGEKSREKPYNLSQGEQQRVAIARALINKPDVILADEPTSALDDVNCNEVIGLLEAQSKEANATLLIVTHDGRLKEHITNQIYLQVQA